jgi:hypothetical protein
MMPKQLETIKMSVHQLYIMDISSQASKKSKVHISRDSPLPNLKLHLPSPETPGRSTVNWFWKNA